MSKISNTKMKLKKASPPLMDDGIYDISVVQQVTAPVAETFPPATAQILVSHPHFNVLPDEVYNMYPSTGILDDFSNTLPHIVLNREVTPWVHSERPWLALICLKKDEVAASNTMTIKELLANSSDDVFSPIAEAEEFAAEDHSASCSTIDISRETFENIMPGLEELDLFTHVRKTYMGEKEDILTRHPGLFSVVVGNRFIPSAVEQPVKSTAYLVSVEFWYKYLRQKGGNGEWVPGAAIPKPNARLVVLHQWELSSQTTPYLSFRQTFEQLNYGAFCNLHQTPAFFQRGHVPKLHITRSGEKTISLVRGPLAPYNIETHEKMFFADGKFSGDGYLKYDPENGIFDTTYAVAWQLGRMMALKRKTMADEIYHWKRQQQNDGQVKISKSILAGKCESFIDNNAKKKYLTELVKEMLKYYNGGEQS